MNNSNSMEQQILSMWTVYDHPSDYPSFYVARCWDIYSGHVWATQRVFFNANLDKLRADIVLQGCYHRLERNEGDDPVIMETWI